MPAPKALNMKARGKRPNNVRRVAPGKSALIREALKERNNWLVFRTFSALFKIILITRGDAFRCASRLPLAFLLRAFGAGISDFRAKPM